MSSPGPLFKPYDNLVTISLNGKEFSAQGNEAEVKTFVFDNTGMKTVASGPGQAPVGDTSNQ